MLDDSICFLSLLCYSFSLSLSFLRAFHCNHTYVHARGYMFDGHVRVCTRSRALFSGVYLVFTAAWKVYISLSRIETGRARNIRLETRSRRNFRPTAANHAARKRMGYPGALAVAPITAHLNHWESLREYIPKKEVLISSSNNVFESLDIYDSRQCGIWLA